MRHLVCLCLPIFVVGNYFDSRSDVFEEVEGLVPESYTLRLRAYLPGYVKFPTDKEFTYETQLVFKFKVSYFCAWKVQAEKDLVDIDLHSIGLKFRSIKLRRFSSGELERHRHS